MKFTSEDLLNAMGLKVNDIIYVIGRNMKYVVKFSNWNLNPLLINLDSSIDADVWLVDILNEEYEIIQPKQTLTEDEKVILRNLPNQYKFIMRDGDKNKDLIISSHKMIRSSVKDNWCIIPKDKECECMVTNVFGHLFQFIKWEDEPYSIEKLLKE